MSVGVGHGMQGWSPFIPTTFYKFSPPNSGGCYNVDDKDIKKRNYQFLKINYKIHIDLILFTIAFVITIQYHHHH